MIADLLRTAAALMRERAENSAHAQMGPLTWTGSFSGKQHLTTAHYNAWHPLVALAVADLLDNVAGHVEYSGATEASEDVRDALTVARAYLGADSP